jgi:hypothetical protein
LVKYAAESLADTPPQLVVVVAPEQEVRKIPSRRMESTTNKPFFFIVLVPFFRGMIHYILKMNIKGRDRTRQD